MSEARMRTKILALGCAFGILARPDPAAAAEDFSQSNTVSIVLPEEKGLGLQLVPWRDGLSFVEDELSCPVRKLGYLNIVVKRFLFIDQIGNVLERPQW